MTYRYHGLYPLAAALALAIGPAATASGLSGSNGSDALPGNAEVLLNPAVDPLVKVLVNQPDATGVSHANHVTQLAGTTSGWNIQDVRLRYLEDSDTMVVAVNSFGIIGDADGNGSATVASQAMSKLGGIKYANMGGTESVTVAFDTNNDGRPDVVAGVPATLPNPLDPQSKSQVPGAGLNGFLVSKYTSGTIQTAYGDHLANNQGTLIADPSAENPDFIFTIKNWSTLPGLEDPKRFGLFMYAGSADDVVSGEDSMYVKGVAMPSTVVPEPATLLLWGGLLAAAGCRTVRSRKLARSRA